MEKPTVCLTFDFDAESVQIREREELGRVSKGQFAVRRGIPRILALLKKHGIRGTFFTCGWVAEEYPELVKEIVSDNHELGAHGYLHEHFDQLSIPQERIIIEKMTTPLKEFTNQITGFRAPFWQLSSNTLDLIAEAGYIYDSSLFSDDRPYIIQPLNLVEFPVEWFLDDWVIFEIHQHSPITAFGIWKSQFDSIIEQNDIPSNRLVFTLTCHPAAIGHLYRLNVLEKLINHMKSKNATFLKMGDVAEQIIRE
ncbi:MAG: polysaccharide deacetylase family protein [Candidatus Hodarchaeales archaeon]|jgi:peptidoglycan/xylan/chitin deacetylase (PgdA/CDA1 family)